MMSGIYSLQMDGSDVILILTTLPNPEAAEVLARSIVGGGFAACVNQLPGAVSFFNWEGGGCAESETLLICKTTCRRYAELEAFIRKTHPYELPEIIAIPVIAGLPEYLNWVRVETGDSSREKSFYIQPDKERISMIQVGSKAPGFSLEAVTPDGAFKPISLTDYRGKWVVLFFYPLDFTFVCPTEITSFSKRSAEFAALNAEILGASVDSVYSHRAWIESSLGKVSYPLLSDPTHSVSREYGVLLEDVGHTLRGTFIIDPEGILRYQLVHSKSVGRSVEETLRVLTALQSGDLCPVEWKPGETTLGKA